MLTLVGLSILTNAHLCRCVGLVSLKRTLCLISETNIQRLFQTTKFFRLKYSFLRRNAQYTDIFLLNCWFLVVYSLCVYTDKVLPY